MIQILLHSSKTMRSRVAANEPLGVPRLLDDAQKLAAAYGRLATDELAKLMAVSSVKATEVKQMFGDWSGEASKQTPAVDAFIGDIYSGLQVRSWMDADREYAQRHLLILSGLYGGLRACDGIMPYRLEMAYKLPDGGSLYAFWGDRITSLLPDDTSCIVNLSALEYTKAVLPYLSIPVVAPKFLTVSPKTGEPTFVTVHAKIARGAFARWMITQQIDDPSRLHEFNDLGYIYNAVLSTPEQPVFVCEAFEGLGLSVRLT